MPMVVMDIPTGATHREKETIIVLWVMLEISSRKTTFVLLLRDRMPQSVFCEQLNQCSISTSLVNKPHLDIEYDVVYRQFFVGHMCMQVNYALIP